MSAYKDHLKSLAVGAIGGVGMATIVPVGLLGAAAGGHFASHLASLTGYLPLAIPSTFSGMALGFVASAYTVVAGAKAVINVVPIIKPKTLTGVFGFAAGLTIGIAAIVNSSDYYISYRNDIAKNANNESYSDPGLLRGRYSPISSKG